MNIRPLVSKAHQAGITIDMSDGVLRLFGPASPLADQLRAREPELRRLYAAHGVYMWSEPLETWVWVLADHRTASVLPSSHRMERIETEPGIVEWHHCAEVHVPNA